MAHLIDKAAIENILRNLWQTDNGQNSEHRICYNKALQEVQCKLDTLEVKDLPIWEKVSPDTGQTTLYKDGDKSYLERFGYRIALKDLDKLPKKNLKSQKGE